MEGQRRGPRLRDRPYTGLCRPLGSCGEPQPSTRLSLSLSPSLCPHAGAYPAGHCSSLAPATSPATASGHQLAPSHCSPASVALADTGARGVERSTCGIVRRCRGPALAWRPLLVQPAGLARQWWHCRVWAPTAAQGGQRTPGLPAPCQRVRVPPWAPRLSVGPG